MRSDALKATFLACATLLAPATLASAQEIGAPGAVAPSTAPAAVAATEATVPMSVTLPPRRPRVIAQAKPRVQRAPDQAVSTPVIRVVDNRIETRKPLFWMTVGNGF